MLIFRYCPQCGHPLPSSTTPPERVLVQICSSCGIHHFKNAKPSVSTIVVSDGQLLLARRVHTPFRGWWNLPGGFLEPWENPVAGATREVVEETGLMVRITDLLEISVYRYGDLGEHILNIYYLAEPNGGELRTGDEADEVRWFTPDALPEQIAFVSNRSLLTTWKDRPRMIISRQGRFNEVPSGNSPMLPIDLT